MTRWFGLVAAFALVDWIAVGTKRRGLEYVFKPVTTATLLSIAFFQGILPALEDSGAYDRLFVAILVALAFSLAGDVFLMLDERWFLAGLSSFLLAHVAYIAAFWPLRWTSTVAIAAVAVAACSVSVFSVLRRHIVDDALLGSVFIYMLAISTMVVTAISFGLGRGGAYGYAVVAGALFFYCSDALIGWHRFVRPLRWAPVAIMVTYHLGQSGLVLALWS